MTQPALKPECSETPDALLIPIGHRFWVENMRPDDLVFLCCGTPPWPGSVETVIWGEGPRTSHA